MTNNDVELFDSHAHYDDEKFKDDAKQVITEAYDSGVKYILNVGSDIPTSKKSIELSEEFKFVYSAVGIHPHEVNKMKDGDIKTLGELCLHPKVVAIGEIGLDYYYDFSPRDIQRHWFSKQIKLSKDLEMPIIVHDRDAHEDILKIVKNEAPFKASGVFHCFAGSWEMAKEILELGLYISFGGAITFKNARKVIDVLKNVPMDRILIETDCPYMTPEPYRGKRNDSAYIKLVAEKIAEIKKISFEEVEKITTENTKELFKIDI